MDRNVRVNAQPEGDGFNPINQFPAYPAAGAPAHADQGPCLYLGPSGQRCDEKAFEGGFCAKHQPGAAPPITAASKVVAASAGIIGLLWPYLADLVREIIRLIHSQ
jgi:hypothetical protein